ncbi:hypothetical protein Hte_006287 [Hypoxylon texense]
MFCGSSLSYADVFTGMLRVKSNRGHQLAPLPHIIAVANSSPHDRDKVCTAVYGEFRMANGLEWGVGGLGGLNEFAMGKWMPGNVGRDALVRPERGEVVVLEEEKQRLQELL